MYGQMTAGSWIYIGTPGHRAGHLRVLRGDRAAPVRRLARGDDHADRRARRDGRRAAAGGDDERRRRAVRRGRRASASSAGSRRATSTSWPTRSTTRSRAASAREGERRALQRRAAGQRRRRAAAAARAGLRGRHRHRPDERPRPARRLRPEPDDARGGRRAARASDPEEYVRRSRAAIAAHCAAMVGFLDARRRGLRLRQQPARRGPARRLRARVRLPGLRARLHPAAVLRGQGPVPLGRAVGRPGRHRRDRPRGARGVPRRRAARALDPAGRRADRVPGAAGADLLARLRRAPPARAALQRDGRAAASSARRS